MSDTHPAATPIGFSLKLKPPSKRRSSGSCKRNCAGGNHCVCWGDVAHVHHICSDERCVCHSREVYEGKGL